MCLDGILCGAFDAKRIDPKLFSAPGVTGAMISFYPSSAIPLEMLTFSKFKQGVQSLAAHCKKGKASAAVTMTSVAPTPFRIAAASLVACKHPVGSKVRQVTITKPARLGLN